MLPKCIVWWGIVLAVAWPPGSLGSLCRCVLFVFMWSREMQFGCLCIAMDWTIWWLFISNEDVCALAFWAWSAAQCVNLAIAIAVVLFLESVCLSSLYWFFFANYTVIVLGSWRALTSIFFIHAVELMKQSSCSMQLTNKTDHYVAFKVICCQMSHCHWFMPEIFHIAL